MTYYQDQLVNAQNAATNAQQNAAALNISSIQVNLRNAQNNLTTATNVYNGAKDAFAKCPTCLTVYAYDRMISWSDAVNLYTDAVNQVNTIQLQLDQAQRQNASTLTTAQENLDDGAGQPVWGHAPGYGDGGGGSGGAGAGAVEPGERPDDAGPALQPGPGEFLAAQAAVANAQAVLDSFTLKAPVDGEVLNVNFQTGDVPTQTVGGGHHR